MHNLATGQDRESNYKLMVDIIGGMLKDESDLIANLANLSSVMAAYLDDINWVGFYLMRDGELVVGPFQGLPACTRIAVGKGVCGTAVAERRTQLVADVHAFPGHIACDSASNSEIVVPIFVGDTVFGVIDVDSPSKARFTELEQTYIEQVAALVGEFLSQ